MNTIPVDIWSLILGSLTLNDITKFLQISTAARNIAFHGGVTHVKLHFSSSIPRLPTILPLWISRFHQLKTFTLSHVRWSSIEDPALPLTLVASLPRSLKRIKLEMHVECVEAYFPFFPQNLEQLQLEFLCRHGIGTAFEDIPKNLIRFRTGSIVTASHTTIANLPRSLTHLEFGYIRKVHPGAFKYLPPHLTFLNFTDPRHMPAEAFNHLPKNLVSLTIGWNSKFTDENFALLPRTLRSLSITSHRIYGTHIAQIPPNLTELYFSSYTLSIDSIRSLPCLNLLKLEFDVPILKNYIVKDLPRSLTYLKCEGLSRECKEDLPPKLTSLSLKLIGI